MANRTITRGAAVPALALVLAVVATSARAQAPSPATADRPAAAPAAKDKATTEAPSDTGARGAADTSSAAAKPAPKALPPELAPKLNLTVSPTSDIAVGDVVTLKLEAEVPRGVDVAVPEQSLEPFEMLDRRAHSEPRGEKQHFTFELDLLVLDAGALTIPSLRVRVVGPNGELGETNTQARTIQVKSLIANEPNAEPKGPSAPVAVIQDDYTLAWVLGGIFLLILVVVTTLLVSRHMAKRPKVQPPPPPPRPAWELALEKLDQLKRRKDSLLEADRGEEFVEGVSGTLREYLGRRYGFDGLESTTDEILRTLEKLRPYKLSLSGVSLLLEQCDLVKFARAKPDEAQCDDLWNGASGLVRATTPEQKPEAAPGATS
jgi:hypothetical protein